MKKIDFAIALLGVTRDFGLDCRANRMPGTACAAMMILAKHGGWIRGTDMGTRLRVTPNSFSCVVRTLYALGLIDRRPSKLGRFNGWDWKLTARGEKAVSAILTTAAARASEMDLKPATATGR